MQQNVKLALLGCLEFCLFMKVAVERFVNTREAAKTSFVIPVLLLPVGVWLAQLNPEFSQLPPMRLALKFVLDFALTTFAYLVFMYFIAKALERDQYFKRFVVACNWMNIGSLVMMAPFFGLVIADIYSYEEVSNLIIFLTMYYYAVLAFMITHIFKINWMLSTSLAIVSMALGQFSNMLIY